MDYMEAIRKGGEAKVSYNEIARKIFLTYPTHAFVGEEERQYKIYNEIANFFEVSISSIHVVGSAKIGKSFHKGRDFIPGSSDLDIAIIDARLFIKYMELVSRISKGYSDLTRFPVIKTVPAHETYLSYLSKGIFNFDLMVMGPERAKVNNFFGGLSSRYSDLFGSISAVLYLSQSFFESKQRSVIKNFFDRESY
ncbi:hypothetical protein [Pseudomonas sp. LG1E9]|uniref:hypothetical protein n=1 Tax=Pseudomonas sp. LG1E9 TaxID=2219057 RepID=UPI000DD33729|nr:hypothetical protein [Pseudomonas sp. LG1E9]